MSIEEWVKPEPPIRHLTQQEILQVEEDMRKAAKELGLNSDMVGNATVETLLEGNDILNNDKVAGQ